jgi:hypothetical protein
MWGSLSLPDCSSGDNKLAYAGRGGAVYVLRPHEGGGASRDQRMARMRSSAEASPADISAHGHSLHLR